jgi:hypothetical protein
MINQFAEFNQYISPDGSVFNFEGIDKCIVAEDGYGIPDTTYITQRAVGQQGETLESVNLSPRIIQFVVDLSRSNRHDYWARREELIEAFRFNKARNLTLGVLRKLRPDGTIRDIDVQVIQGPKFAYTTAGGYNKIVETLRFFAPYPIFYDPNTIVTSITTDSEDHLVFQRGGPGTGDVIFATSPAFRALSGSNEYALPGFVFASSILAVSEAIVYTGNWEAFPRITIVGPIGDPEIINISTGRRIALNYSIESGETVLISLRFGNKQVTSSQFGNIISTVDDLGGLAKFSLAPRGEVAGGINTILFNGSGITGVTSISIAHEPSYIGI